MISMFISLSDRTVPAPLCAGMPLDSCTVAAGCLAALFDRRRTVVPFPFVAIAMSYNNLLEKKRRATFLLTDTVCFAPGQEGAGRFIRHAAVRSRVETRRPLKIRATYH